LLAIQENTPKINPEITPTIGPVTHIIRLGCAAIMSARDVGGEKSACVI